MTGEAERASPEALAAAQWVGATAAERGETLKDLLHLADSLPQMGRGKRPPLDFPRLESR
jgi:hypothetical protein